MTGAVDAACLREWKTRLQESRQFSSASPNGFDEADAATTGCDARGMASWDIANGEFLLCAPRACGERAVARLAGLAVRWHSRAAGSIGAPELRNATVPRVARIVPISSLQLDFVVAGFSHSGTTSLHRALNDHPDVDMHSAEAEDGGELHELFWYTRLSANTVAKTFAGFRANATRGVRSTWAVTEDRVIKRLATIPNLKVILVLRDPLSQLDSMLGHGFGFFSPFGQEAGLTLLHSASILAKHALGYWPASRVLPVPFAQLKTAPGATIERVYQFLGLDPKLAGTSARHRHWLHRRPARLPVSPERWKQSLCDIRVDWRPMPLEGQVDLGLPLRALLRAHFAPERRLLEAFLGDYEWPPPRLDMHACPGDTSPGRHEHEYVPGAHDFCEAAKVFVRAGRIRASCLAGDACQRCCVFLQARCEAFWECCAPVQAAIREATLPSLRQALCGSSSGRWGGCCAAVGSLQSP